MENYGIDLCVISSSSKGNSYALVSRKETLLLEAGVSLREVKRMSGYPANIVGCCVSHVHGDHAKYIEEYAKYYPVVCNYDVAEKKEIECIIPNEGKTVYRGGFSITPFSVKHDVPNYGYLIHHKEMGTLLFATDTDSLPYKFPNINHWLIEANYSDRILQDMLKDGKIDKAQKDRIVVSHMSLENCIRNLKASNADFANTITLIHLSSRHSNAKEFKDEVVKAFGVPTYVAEPGRIINLNLNGTI